MVSSIRARIAYPLNPELGISIAEISKNGKVGTTAVIKAIKKIEARQGKL